MNPFYLLLALMTVYYVCLSCVCPPESKEHALCYGSVIVMFNDWFNKLKNLISFCKQMITQAKVSGFPYCVLLVQVGHRSFSVHSMFGPMGGEGCTCSVTSNPIYPWDDTFFPAAVNVFYFSFSRLGPSRPQHCSLNDGAHFQMPLAAYCFTNKIWHLTTGLLRKVFLIVAGSVLVGKPL